MPGQHAPFAPSAAHRWLRCPGSYNAEAECTDNESTFAREGTLAHEVAATCLKQGGEPGDFVDMVCVDGVWRKADNEVDDLKVTDSMAEYVSEYVHKVRELSSGHVLLVEQRLVVLPGEVYGTGDVVILRKDDSGEAIVDDLKFGVGVKVSALDNEQIMTYGVGVLETYDGLLADIKAVRGIIDQPRNGGVSEDVWSRDKLLAFKETLRAGVAAARDPKAPRIPGEKQCRFCKAAGSCPELREYVYKTAIVGLTDVSPAGLLGLAMSRVAIIESWTKAVRAEVERRLLAGESVPGWKLVTGRQGARAWLTDEAATVAGLKAAKLKKSDLFTAPALLSPSKIETLLKSKHKDKKRGAWKRVWESTVEKLIAPRVAGRPSVALESDPRPAYVVRPALEGLSVVNPEQLANTEATEQKGSE